MKQAATRQLFQYWNNLRRDRSAPDRGEIDPAKIRGILRDTFILEIDAERACPLRVAGARIDALFTRELRSTSFVDLWHEEDRTSAAALIESVIDDHAPVLADVRAAARGRLPVDLELLLLPLRPQGESHARMLGSLTPAALPRWYGLLPAVALELTALHILGPEFGGVVAVTVPDRADAQTPRFEGQWRPPARTFHLAVHENGGGKAS